MAVVSSGGVGGGIGAECHLCCGITTSSLAVLAGGYHKVALGSEPMVLWYS